MAVANRDNALRDYVRRLSEQGLREWLGSFWRQQSARVVNRFLDAERIRPSMAAEILPRSENVALRVGLERAIEAPATRLAEVELARTPPAPPRAIPPTPTPPPTPPLRTDPRLTPAGRLVAPRPITVYHPRGELPRIDELVRRQTSISAKRVVQINATTRRAIRREIQTGIDRGYTREQIARGVPADNYRGIGAVVDMTYKNRDRTIARTELAFINNRAQLHAYMALGYERVKCYDSAACGLVGHDDPRKPADHVYNIKAAITHAISHPNCIRRWVPVIIPNLPRPDLGGAPAPVGVPPGPPIEVEVPEDLRMLPADKAREAITKYWEEENFERGAQLGQQIAKLEREANELNDWIYKQPIRHLADGVTIDTEWFQAEIQAKMDRASKLMEEAMVLRRGPLAQVKNAVLGDLRERYLFQPSRADMVINLTSQPRDPAERRAYEKGTEWWRRLVGANHEIREARTFDGAPVPVSIRRMSGQRAYYDQRFRRVTMGDYKKRYAHYGDDDFHGAPATVTHELTHYWEYNDPYIREQTKKYFHERTDGETAQRLKKLAPRFNYGPREVAKPDRFMDPYAGKVYPGDEAHEILTMAAQWYVTDPLKLAREDPELFDWFHELIRRRRR